MHGLIFVTWENYLGERFGAGTLHTYRTQVRHSLADAVLASKIYSDEALLEGVGVASALTQTPADTLLREYGQYFIVNGLTSRLCAYLLTQVRSGRDLLLAMRDAHEQMSATAEAMAPPIFEYRAVPNDPIGLVVIYDSPRQLCPLLLGSIEGAAIRYGERVEMREQTCMRHGAAACEIVVRFTPGLSASQPEPDAMSQQRWDDQRQLADLVYALLPDHDGITLAELQARLRAQYALPEQLRPFLLLEALNHLHHAGWCATSANEPNDALGTRRYWRLPRVRDH